MTRMAGPDCAVMCNLINRHTHTHTHNPPSGEQIQVAENDSHDRAANCAAMRNSISIHKHCSKVIYVHGVPSHFELEDLSTSDSRASASIAKNEPLVHAL